MPDAIVTKPFTAHLVLDGVERRLEVGERLVAGELAHWGRSVDALINTGRIALVDQVTAGEASVETLVNSLVERAGELPDDAIAKLRALLPSEDPPAGGTEAEGVSEAGGAEGEPGGAADAPGSQPSADDSQTAGEPTTATETPAAQGDAAPETAETAEPAMGEPAVGEADAPEGEPAPTAADDSEAAAN